jgi:hypothetical protein
MNRFISGVFLCLLVTSGFAQKSPIKFGEISLEDLKMRIYDKDSSASAVILCDYGQSEIVYNQSTGFSLNFERITRIKFFNKDGFDWANFSIPLYHDGSTDEKITGLKALTYNLENGKIVQTKAKSDGFFKEQVNANLDLMKITVPNVKEGSIVEITYKINSDFLFNFWDWEFQSTIPTQWSEYRSSIPEFYHYDKYMQGYIGLDINESKEVPSSITITTSERTGGQGFSSVKSSFNTDKIDFKEEKSRWVAKNVPAFKAEPFITTYKDYISKMNFEMAYTKFPEQPIKPIMGSWEEINKKYTESEDFGKAITGNGFLKKTVEELMVGTTTNQERIVAIHNFVKQNFTWDGASRKSLDGTLKKVFENKKGNSAEINLLLGSMLDKAGFTVYPILVSTRDHGFIRESTPVSSQFNYALCLVELEGKQIFLDATDKLLPLGVLPERCLNGNGFVVSKMGHRWSKLSSPIKTKSYFSAELVCEPTGEMKGKISLDRTGYSALLGRKKYFSKTENEYVKDFVGTHSWEVSKSEFKNAKEFNESFKETHDVVISDHATSSGEMIYLNPFVSMQEMENPFKAEKRDYPVDFGSPLERLYVSRISVPKGYVVEELPASQIFVLPGNGAKYLFNIATIGDAISITSNLQINKSLFLQEEYPDLREFYNRVVAKQAEQIVLKKK